MGCFDSVFCKCEECGEKIELQSKAGGCDLKRYRPHRVPLSIAGDLDDDIVKCKNCGKEYTVAVQYKYVGLLLLPTDEED